MLFRRHECGNEEKSEIAEVQRFPLSDEGRDTLRDYLEALRDKAN